MLGLAQHGELGQGSLFVADQLRRESGQLYLVDVDRLAVLELDILNTGLLYGYNRSVILLIFAFAVVGGQGTEQVEVVHLNCRCRDLVGALDVEPGHGYCTYGGELR